MELVTKKDLFQFKTDLLNELREVLKTVTSTQKEYLKSREVMEMLGCSESKLSSLRVSGKLPASKIQGTYYYKIDEVQKLMEG